ncbi:NUDIX domain-containing protein [Candidatus Woesearchaeota archaeon]|nr:NUDIX domain-containing protein [Candidatus Woesearchaeota archaeon]
MVGEIVIVNEHDQIIGYKKRTECLPHEIYRVSALMVKNSKGEVLLARRAYTKKHDPGCWGPAVAGTVEKGETYEQNIIKEAQEELGIENVQFEQGQKRESKGKYHHFTQWFNCILDWPITKFKIQKEEVDEIKWFTVKELERELKINPEQFIPSIQREHDIYVR